MTDLPRLGVALIAQDFPALRNWILDADRPVELQDFVGPDVAAGDPSELVSHWRPLLAGHRGLRGIHGPFFGLEITNPDTEMRAIIQRRFLSALGTAEALGATHMVIHSPFSYWHTLNYANYQGLRESLFQAAAECLAPVLARAAEAGCTLVLENVDDAAPKDRADLAAMIGHPSLALSVDTGHALLAHGRYGAPPPVDFIQSAGASLLHVHLQDADGYADRHWHPGEGCIAWAPVMAAIARANPKARLILEVARNRHLLPRCAAWMQSEGLAC